MQHRGKSRPINIGLLALIGVVASIAGCDRGNSSSAPIVASSASLLPAAQAPPAGVATSVFAPPGLGLSVTLPANWQGQPPVSGFQFMMSGPRRLQTFLLASKINGEVKPLSAAQAASYRRQVLQTLGATISSVRTGTIDNHAAVALHYTISHAGETVSDLEYDLIVPGPLTVSLGPTQTSYDTAVTAYNIVIVVLGARAAGPAPALLNWIASSIAVTG